MRRKRIEYPVFENVKIVAQAMFYFNRSGNGSASTDLCSRMQQNKKRLHYEVQPFYHYNCAPYYTELQPKLAL